MKRRKILWLASWYPSDTDPLTGDFVERHARAASLFEDVTVLYVVRSRNKKSYIRSKQYHPYLKAMIFYYSAGPSVVSLLRYVRGYLKLLKMYIREQGKPQLAHVHVCFRAGLPALYLKYRYGIPYLISEHWSFFNDAAPLNFNNAPAWLRATIRKIYQGSAGASAVSVSLTASISKKTQVAPLRIIPNVFDARLFYPNVNRTGVFRFIHISQLNYAKNAGQIIEATALLRQLTGSPFTLTIYGPEVAEIRGLIAAKQLEDIVSYHHEVPQPDLAEDLRRHNVLVLYSRYEGLPCVIIEAHACGLPVIVSDIPSMHEMVDASNGMIVEAGNPRRLAESMKEMMDEYGRYHPYGIQADATKKYNFETVGKMFSEWYDEHLLTGS